MNINDIKTVWAGYSSRKKWIISGVAALLCLGSVNAGQRTDQNGYAEAAAGGHGGPGRTANDATGYAVGRYNSLAQSGFGSGAAPRASAEPPSNWEQNQRDQDRAATAFSQNIREQSTVRDTATGEVISEVPNTVADPAIASGAATSVPTAELPEN